MRGDEEEEGAPVTGFPEHYSLVPKHRALLMSRCMTGQRADPQPPDRLPDWQQPHRQSVGLMLGTTHLWDYGNLCEACSILQVPHTSSHGIKTYVPVKSPHV